MPERQDTTGDGWRPYNFSAGPATIPAEVLRQAAAEMLDWQGSGMGVMEMSHRGSQFGRILAQTRADLATLLELPEGYHVLFMQGGALAQNALVPLNLSRGEAADYLVTGSWSRKSEVEARRYCDVAVAAAPAGAAGIPPRQQWRLRPEARYLHYCSNETIDGIEFHATPDAGGLPLVADMSSNILSGPVDVAAHACIYAGAQKNIGPAGLTLVIVRDDMLGHALPACPTVFDYTVQARNDSMANTPPTWAIYISGLVFQWLLRQSEDTPAGTVHGLAAIAARNARKAELLYGCIDTSGLYVNDVDPAQRSRMNVPFRLRDPALDADFLAGATERGLLQLKGHKSVGGMRASLYNAMPVAGVQALVDYMREFERSR